MRSRPRTSRRRVMAGAAVAALGAGVFAACADDGGSEAAGGSGGGGGRKTTVTVGTFGVFGYKQAGLYEAYEKLHPDITIKESVIERNDAYYPQLLTHLAAAAASPTSRPSRWATSTTWPPCRPTGSWTWAG
ncbi:hypothetical protein ACFQ2B_20695 [Streptomyces stramineus]